MSTSATITDNLPPQITPFVGRVEEVAEITRRLADLTCRLVTLVGPGGIGKTRLALEAARHAVSILTDGVFFVPLQPLASPDFIVPAIATATGLWFYPGGEPKQQLLNHLREKSLLLVLDSFEHLLDGAEIISDILAYAPDVKILTTSRERLNLVEEWILDVEGLPIPASDHDSEIEEYGAVQLFLQSAQRVNMNFKLTETHQPAVTRICRLVGGMPLGIELAAAWVRALSCEEIADEIEHSLDILATSARNVSPRHRNMRAALEHSWHLLTQIERNVFKNLSVFRGGFRKDAAQYVTGASLHTLSALVDKSLLGLDANGRYDLHELLRQYAHEKLTESGEAKIVLDHHLDYFLAFAENAEPELFGTNQLDWFNRVETEHSNLRAAIGWSLESGNIAAGLRLTSSLWWFWCQRGYHQEGYEQLMDILSLPEAKPRTTIRAKALTGAGCFQWFEGNYTNARFLLEEAIAIAREVGSLQEIAQAVRFLGSVLYSLGDHQAARLSLEESLILERQLQNRFGIAWSLLFLGEQTLQQGNTEQAQTFYQESIDLLRELQDKVILAMAVRRLGLVMCDFGEYERSKALCQESLQMNLVIGDRRGVAASLIGLAGIADVQGHAVHAAQLLSAAERLLNDIAAQLLFLDQREYERRLMAVRTHLDTPTFDRAWAEGQAMSMEQAVTYALRSNEPEATQPQPPGSQPLAEPLIDRELEILQLLADGLSTREVAQQLFLTVGTVKWYLNQAYSKLSVHSRIQAIARARELKLLA